MDKQLLKAYIRTIVEEEVKKILPDILGEAISEIKKLSSLNESKTVAEVKKPSIDRGRLAQLLNIDYDGETIRATTNSIASTLTTVDAAGNKIEVPASKVDPAVVNAITKDYSQLMKAMKIA